MTKQDLQDLHIGQILHHTRATNADGSPLRCRINGRLKLWKTRPDDFRLPVKYGLKQCFYITPDNIDEWQIPAEDTQP